MFVAISIAMSTEHIWQIFPRGTVLDVCIPRKFQQFLLKISPQIVPLTDEFQAVGQMDRIRIDRRRTASTWLSTTRLTRGHALPRFPAHGVVYTVNVLHTIQFVLLVQTSSFHCHSNVP